MTVAGHVLLFRERKKTRLRRRCPVRLRDRPSSPLAPREDRRIAANLDWHLKALMNRSVNGYSAFFSRSEKATFAEILKLD